MLNRKKAPRIIDAAEFQLDLPPHQKHTLRNGVDLYLVDMGTQDTLMINLIFFAGNWFEEKNLVAASTNFLLKNGTKKKSAFAINEHFEYYGAYLNRHAHHETAEITLHCMNKHSGELLPVVAELLMESTFPQDELAIYQKNMQQKLRVNLEKNDFVATRLIEAALFGEAHPYGRYSQLEDFQALEQEEIKAFHKKYYQEGHCIIFAAGRLPKDFVEQMEHNIGSLPLKGSQKPVFTGHPIIPAKEKKYSVSNDPDGVQGAIRIARNFPNRHHPDFQKMQVLNNLFGGFFGSRLMLNIREDKGYTYGIHSYILNLLQETAFMVSTEAGTEVSAATIKEVYKEMKLLRDEPVDAEELQATKNYMIGTLLGDLDGPFHVAGRWKSILLNDLDANYFYRGIDTIKNITPLELQELANKYLQQEDFYELVVV